MQTYTLQLGSVSNTEISFTTVCPLGRNSNVNNQDSVNQDCTVLTFIILWTICCSLKCTAEWPGMPYLVYVCLLDSKLNVHVKPEKQGVMICHWPLNPFPKWLRITPLNGTPDKLTAFQIVKELHTFTNS